MPSHVLTARNHATESENKIHDDTVARRFGFEGGLVPGVTLYAYLAGTVAEAWGEQWLRGGRMAARFGSPIYDGGEVTAAMSDDGDLTLTDGSGKVCVTGSAALPDGSPAEAPPEIPAAALPSVRPPADEASLAPGTVLGSIENEHTREIAESYLDDIGNHLPLFRETGYAHPGWLLRAANQVLVDNVALGPWIHVESRATLLHPVALGQTVRTHARVVDRREHKGHHFVDLDVVTSTDEGPAMWTHHIAIYRPRQVAG